MRIVRRRRKNVRKRNETEKETEKQREFKGKPEVCPSTRWFVSLSYDLLDQRD